MCKCRPTDRPCSSRCKYWPIGPVVKGANVGLQIGPVLNTVQYNITLLPSVNTLIARGMFFDAKYTHHTFTPVIKHLIATTTNKHPGKKSFIDKKV